MQLLLSHDAPVDAVKSGDWTPLMLAAAAGSPGSVKHLLDAGARPALRNKDGASAVHLAAKADCASALRLMLDCDEGVVHWRTRNGRTPLHYAARAGSEECVKLLLESGADVGAREKSGMCAGQEAAAEGCVRVLKVLMEVPGGTEAAWEGDVGGLTVLHHAVVNGGKEVTEVAAAKAGEGDVQRKDGRGQTAMFLAIWHAREGVVEVLRGRGARVLREWVGKFRDAGREQSAELVQRLLEDGG